MKFVTGIIDDNVVALRETMIMNDKEYAANQISFWRDFAYAAFYQ